MKFTSIFFTASISIFAIHRKYTQKQARNMKFASIFFTTSVSIFAIYRKYAQKVSGIYGIALLMPKVFQQSLLFFYRDGYGRAVAWCKD